MQGLQIKSVEFNYFVFFLPRISFVGCKLRIFVKIQTLLIEKNPNLWKSPSPLYYFSMHLLIFLSDSCLGILELFCHGGGGGGGGLNTTSSASMQKLQALPRVFLLYLHFCWAVYVQGLMARPIVIPSSYFLFRFFRANSKRIKNGVHLPQDTTCILLSKLIEETRK
jgi:hypothetical protein